MKREKRGKNEDEREGASEMKERKRERAREEKKCSFTSSRRRSGRGVSFGRRGTEERRLKNSERHRARKGGGEGEGGIGERNGDAVEETEREA